jgi:transglutaminase-like putative cysteine protease
MKALLAASFLLSGPRSAQEDLLRNGDFEKGSARDIPQWTGIHPPNDSPPPEFLHPKEGAKVGKRCAAITTKANGGYTSWTQIVDPAPKEAKAAKLEGWIRAEATKEGTSASASLLLLFVDERDATLGLHHSQRVTATSPWTKVSVEVPVPTGARRWMVRCGLSGNGTAYFDDVRLTAGTSVAEQIQATLAVGHGQFAMTAEGAAEEPWIRFSIPFPYEGQTPLAIRVKTDPPNRAVRLQVDKERENRLLRVGLRTLAKGESVRVWADSFVLLRSRDLPTGEGTALPSAKDLGPAVQEYLRPAPGIDAEDPEIRKAAAGFPRSDLRGYVIEMFRFMDGALKRDAQVAGGPQGAKEVLQRGGAVCTGNANLAASLLIAGKIPARVLPCVMIGQKQQEHYVVEAWTPSLGWSRLESTMRMFPLDDTKHLILRIAYPDSYRSTASVPLYWPVGSEGVKARYDGDPGNGCWQAAEVLTTFSLDAADADLLESAARKAFDDLVATPFQGGDVRLVRATTPPPSLGEKGRKVLEEVERRLGN